MEHLTLLEKSLFVSNPGTPRASGGEFVCLKHYRNITRGYTICCLLYGVYPLFGLVTADLFALQSRRLLGAALRPRRHVFAILGMS